MVVAFFFCYLQKQILSYCTSVTSVVQEAQGGLL